MSRRFLSLGAIALVLALTVPSQAHAQSQLDTYAAAVRDYDAARYEPACTAFHDLYTSTDGFKSLDAAVVDADKRTGRYLDWQHKAYASDSEKQYAKECVEWYHVGIAWRGSDDMSFVRDAGMYAGRAEENLAREHATSDKPAAAVATSGRTSRLPAPAPRRAASVTPPAAHPAAAKTGESVKSGSGLIPDGDYTCYSATTATLLAGGSARLEPGSWHGVIHISGNSYVISDNPVGHYSVGVGGRITWNGGAYSSKTLGRYVLDRGAPAIVIGWADTDAGLVCTR